ncbi:MAG TPA: nucleotidyl transferase AbiEii/AbiGii toxin family protein [Candidatus Angelobacter sp.]|nr:nucleotidyl transferase AbiEii/AbiGii toxin family protein [Candidatus Angelobacter sp.]
MLYGGTAMALRLGHRQSQDFDFFSNETFDPETLLGIPYLKGAQINQRSNNTLSVLVERGGPVKVSFFGDAQMSHVQEPDLTLDRSLQVASLLDLTATKLKTVQQRAEARDYMDIAAAIADGINLAEALGAARAIYGKAFNPIASLKALTYFEDGNLGSLPGKIRSLLHDAAHGVKIEALPNLLAKGGITRQRMLS